MKMTLGFTLIELMVTVAIAGILLAVGVPSLNQFTQNSDLINSSNRVSMLTAFARSEAIKRNNQVILCRSNNNTSCSSSSSRGSSLIVVNDLNNDSVFGPNDVLLKSVALADGSSDIKLYFKQFSSSMIVFSVSGAPIETGTIEICDNRGPNHAKAIVLNMGGQTRQIDESKRSLLSCT